MKHYPLFKAELIDGKWYAVKIGTGTKYYMFDDSSKFVGTTHFDLRNSGWIYYTAIVKFAENGEKKFYFPFEDEDQNIYGIFGSHAYNEDNYIIIKRNGEVGLIDYNHNILISPEYSSIDNDYYYRDYPNIWLAQKGYHDKYIINVKTKEMFGPYQSLTIYNDKEDDWRKPFFVGEIKVGEEKHYEIIFLFKFKKIHEGVVDNFIIREHEHFLAYDQKGIWTGYFVDAKQTSENILTFTELKNKYEDKPVFTDGFVIVKLDGKYGVVTLDEQTIVPFVYDKIYDYLYMKDKGYNLSKDGNLFYSYSTESYDSGRDDPYGRDFFEPSVETEWHTKVIERNNFKVKEAKLIGRWLCILKE